MHEFLIEGVAPDEVAFESQLDQQAAHAPSGQNKDLACGSPNVRNPPLLAMMRQRAEK